MVDTVKNKKRFVGIVLVFVAVGLGYLGYWWFHGRFYEWTDDAYVNGNSVVVTPQVAGIVTMIYADNTQFVPQGRVLIELDKTDAELALDQTIADLGSMVRKVMEMFEQADYFEALLPGTEAEFIKAEQDYERRKALLGDGGVSLEDFQHAEARLRSSYSQLVALEHQWIGATALVENTTVATHPLVEGAKARLRDAYVALQRCTIAAPVAGLVAQRAAQVGEWVTPGEPLLSVIPLDQMWIDANYKEIQLSKVRIGQKASIRSDLYGGEVRFQGTVVGIAGGTGSVFSVLPPQNATGNWIKIVQRLPVRIQLDPEEVKRWPLRLGLSVETSIDLHEMDLPMIPKAVAQKPLYVTPIFERQEEGSEALIEAVMQENLSQLFVEDQS